MSGAIIVLAVCFNGMYRDMLIFLVYLLYYEFFYKDLNIKIAVIKCHYFI